MAEELNEEQLKELNEIVKLPAKEQQQRLQEFLKTLTPGQIEFLKRNQNQKQCPFCLISEEKIKANIIYKDDVLISALDINPANKGHVIMFPRIHYQSIFQMKDDDLAYFFSVAKYIAKGLIETLNAQGVNFLLCEGEVAGQNIPHMFLHLIPRYKDDGINFSWNIKKINEKEMNEIAEKLRNSLSFEEKKEKEEFVEEYFEEEERIP